VRWSTAHARGDTLARAQGLRLGFLRELEDVDDVTAYERWKVQLLRYTTRRPARRIGRRTDGSD
jgi:hypothetical protein